MSPLIVPIFISLGAFAMVFGIVYLKTRESLAMLEKGFNPRQKQYNSRSIPQGLKIGLLLVGAGTGLLIAFFIQQSMHFDDDGGPIYFALIAIGGGLGLVASYAIERKEFSRQQNQRDRPAE